MDNDDSSRRKVSIFAFVNVIPRLESSMYSVSFEMHSLNDIPKFFSSLIDIKLYTKSLRISNPRIIKSFDAPVSEVDKKIREEIKKHLKGSDWVYYYITQIVIRYDGKELKSNRTEPKLGWRIIDKHHANYEYKPKTRKMRMGMPVIIFVDTGTREVPYDRIRRRQELSLGYFEVWVWKKLMPMDMNRYYEEKVLGENIVYCRKDYGFFREREEFWNKVIDYLKHGDVYVFAWNVYFDFSILWNAEISNKFRLAIEKIFEEGWRAFSRRFIYVVLRGRDASSQRSRRIYFVDAMQFAGYNRLGDVGKILGLEKSADVSRDVEIMREYIFSFIRFVLKFGSFEISMPEVALSILHQNPTSADIPVILDSEVNELLERAFFDADEVPRCTRYSPDREHIVALTVNSIYPFVMLNRMPSRLRCFVEIEPRSSGINVLVDFIKAGFLVIAELDIELPERRYGLLPMRLSRNDICFVHNGLLKGVVICQPELELLISELGAKITKVYRFAVFESDYIFKDAINKLWEMRRNAEAQLDYLTKFIADSIINALHTAFTRRFTKWISKNAMKKEAEWALLTYEALPIGDNPYIWLYRLEMPTHFRNLSIGAFITSYARAYMLSLISRFDEILCVDVGSIIISKSELEKCRELIGDGLGQLTPKSQDISEHGKPRRILGFDEVRGMTPHPEKFPVIVERSTRETRMKAIEQRKGSWVNPLSVEEYNELHRRRQQYYAIKS